MTVQNGNQLEKEWRELVIRMLSNVEKELDSLRLETRVEIKDVKKMLHDFETDELERIRSRIHSLDQRIVQVETLFKERSRMAEKRTDFNMAKVWDIGFKVAAIAALVGVAMQQLF